MNDHRFLDPGLLLCAVLVVAFAGIAWHRFWQRLKADRKWRDECTRYRARAQFEAKGFAVVPDHVDASSLIEDPTARLPNTYRAPCGELVRTVHRGGLRWTCTSRRDETPFPSPNPSDHGPKAA